jgi:hypothetical protein
MSVTKRETKSDSNAKDPYLVYKRRIQKDTLLADNPPRALGAAMVIVAVLLGISVAALRWVEYQDTVPINLTLKTVDFGRTLYGEAYLQPQQLTEVQIEQVVQIDLGGIPISEEGRPEATIKEIATVSENSLYVVRVAFPAELVASSGIGSTLQPGMQVQGKIVTQKQNLFDKLFSFFRLIAHSI